MVTTPENTNAMTDTPAAKPRRRRFLSIRTRMLSAFTVLFTVMFVWLGIGVYNFASLRALDRLAEDLTVLLEGAARGISGDLYRSVTRLSQVDENGYATDPRFWRVVDWLETVKRVDPRAGLYTMSRDSAGRFYLIASGSARTEPTDPGTARFKQPLEIDPVPPEFAALFDGTSRLWLLLNPYEDEFGYWISGYAAIVDSRGEHVGVVGADYHAEYLYEVRQQILIAGIPIFISIYIVFVVMIVLLITRFTNGLNAITRAAERIGEGDYDAKLPKPAPVYQSELDILSEVFSSMVQKLDKRETELRKQVEVLQIEIDQVKAKAQVSEIVETEFFADLQSKARNIRSRRNPIQGANSGDASS
jgi:hypothetical protein